MMGWMEHYGLFADPFNTESVPTPTTVKRIKLADIPTDPEAAEIQHAFEKRMYGIQVELARKVDEALGALLKRANDMPCGILIARGPVIVDDGRVTIKELIGFHPSVPVGEVQYITSHGIGAVAWDVLEKQLLEMGGEHDGEDRDDRGQPAGGVRGEG